MKFLQSLVLACTLLLLLTTFAAAALLDVSPAGGGRFIINGSAMDGVTGMELTIVYDAASLEKPVVSQGALVAGAMMAANTSNTGTIKLAIISTTALAGSGQIAIINFTARASGGSIASIKANLIDIKGAAIPATVTIAGSGTTAPPAPAGFYQTAGVPFSAPGSASQEQQQQLPRNSSSATAAVTTPTTTAAVVTPSIGTLTLSGDVTTPAQPQKAGEMPRPEYQQEEMSPLPTADIARSEESSPPGKTTAAVTAKSAGIKLIRYTSIHERFRDFTGERTLAAFRELFAPPLAEPVRQEPPIAISNGTTVVKIFVTIPALGEATQPTVATNGAKLLSLKNGETAQVWEIELLPRSETLDASVSILSEQRIVEIPLVLIPPAGKPLTFSQNEITAFMKDSGAKKPLFDLNGDGNHDFLDDYIYTGHNLLDKRRGNSELRRSALSP